MTSILKLPFLPESIVSIVISIVVLVLPVEAAFPMGIVGIIIVLLLGRLFIPFARFQTKVNGTSRHLNFSPQFLQPFKDVLEGCYCGCFIIQNLYINPWLISGKK